MRTYTDLLMQELDVLDGFMEHRCRISLRSTHAEVDPSLFFCKEIEFVKKVWVFAVLDSEVSASRIIIRSACKCRTINQIKTLITHLSKRGD
jgi:hypothetical protein